MAPVSQPLLYCFHPGLRNRIRGSKGCTANTGGKCPEGCNRVQIDVAGIGAGYQIIIKMQFSLLFLLSAKFEAIANLLKGEGGD